jgi:hypothetical protein
MNTECTLSTNQTKVATIVDCQAIFLTLKENWEYSLMLMQ